MKDLAFYCQGCGRPTNTLTPHDNAPIENVWDDLQAANARDGKCVFAAWLVRGTGYTAGVCTKGRKSAPSPSASTAPSAAATPSAIPAAK